MAVELCSAVTLKGEVNRDDYRILTRRKSVSLLINNFVNLCYIDTYVYCIFRRKKFDSKLDRLIVRLHSGWVGKPEFSVLLVYV